MPSGSPFQRSAGGVAWRLALAPLPSVFLLITVPQFTTQPAGGWPHPVVSVIVAIVVALVALLFGLPLYYIYRRLGWRSWVLFALGAAAIPTAIFGLPEFLPRNPTFSFSTADCNVIYMGARTACGWQDFLQLLLANSAYGALAGLIFWLLLWKRTQPVIPS